MEDFEFLRHITLGQYLPGDSLVHRLDPRVKISVMLFMTVAITFNVSYLANIILLIVCLSFVLLSKIPLGYILSGVKPALPFIIVLAILQLLFYGDAFVPYGTESRTILRWGWVHVTSGSVQLVVVSTLRFLQLLFLASLLTNTTTISDLTSGMEAMLSPFSRVGLPGHELALVGAIALRFVPILAEQLEIIMKAQASRGADLGAKGRLRFIQTTRQMVALIVPLFIDAFRRAEDLILAMEARCYVGGRHRTKRVRFRFQRADYIAYVLVLLFSAAMVAFRNRMPF
ncbi:MAG TPA: energy-coupling factor transporter transmembrane protein EcfT [Chloroflexi bacterium]|nr:energy-coupling factor transporter transmembrane protein EcfT [Chloroflexota bacterium]